MNSNTEIVECDGKLKNIKHELMSDEFECEKCKTRFLTGQGRHFIGKCESGRYYAKIGVVFMYNKGKEDERSVARDDQSELPKPENK